MSETDGQAVRDVRQWRSLGIQPGDQVEFRVKNFRGFSRFSVYTAIFRGEDWQSFSIHKYRHWWDRLVRWPVRILLNGEEFEPFEFFDEMRRRGMDVSYISAVRVGHNGQELEIPWKNVITMRKIG